MSGAENWNLGVQADKLVPGITSVSDFTVIGKLLAREGNQSSLLSTQGHQLPLHLFSSLSHNYSPSQTVG